MNKSKFLDLACELTGKGAAMTGQLHPDCRDEAARLYEAVRNTVVDIILNASADDVRRLAERHEVNEAATAYRAAEMRVRRVLSGEDDD